MMFKSLNLLTLQIVIFTLIITSSSPLNAAGKSVFSLKNADHKLSPFTGMTRQDWIDADMYLLSGAFEYIHDLDDPMKFPKMHASTYPLKDSQIPTEKLEGLSRTLFLASPLLHEDSSLTINGIKVAEYYRHQISSLVNPESPSWIRKRNGGGPNQILVEFGALTISLFAAPEVLWDPLPQQTKDALAATMISYGDGPTVPSNWKFFNIFVLSFFDQQGYPVNKKLLQEYLEKSLADYRGEGWYNDNPAFDYYSMWAYQMYSVLWGKFYGEKNFPEITARFYQNFRDLMPNYPYLFQKDGKMVMWGRSISYRYAAVTVFPLMGFVPDMKPNWGWMRRISSATLLQFLQHPDFLQDGVPTLGFYGPFEPATQIYSCRGSVYWGGKVFLSLLLPADSPFWTAKEDMGAWKSELKKGKVYNKFEKSSNILISDYPNTGISEIRAWCHADKKSDWQKFRSSENYNRLSYNSQFLWQADGVNGEVAMNYVVFNKTQEWEPLRLFTFKSYENGFYSRVAALETNPSIHFELKEKTLPNGIIRFDRIFADSSLDAKVRLGHYALPRKQLPVRESIVQIGPYNARVIDNGEYQLAMILINSWGRMEIVKSKGLNPESEESSVIDAACDLPKGSVIEATTLMLWKPSGQKWNYSDLPVISAN